MRNMYCHLILANSLKPPSICLYSDIGIQFTKMFEPLFCHDFKCDAPTHSYSFLP